MGGVTAGMAEEMLGEEGFNAAKAGGFHEPQGWCGPQRMLIDKEGEMGGLAGGRRVAVKVGSDTLRGHLR